MYQFSIVQIRWALRRFMLDVPKAFKVVEIGSGGNPTPKSDILIEPYLDGEHKNSKKVVADRPTFVMKAEELPFRDDAFDYSICFHVLEHTDNPSLFIESIQRISRGGYIETPTPLNELLFPYDFHMTAIATSGDNRITAYGLASYHTETLEGIRDSILPYLRSKEFLKFYRRNPRLFNTVIRWKNNIDLEIIGTPKTAIEFSAYQIPNHPHHEKKKTLKQKISPYLRDIARKFFKKDIDILSLLKCNVCEALDIEILEINHSMKQYKCRSCNNYILTEENNIFRLSNSEKNAEFEIN